MTELGNASQPERPLGPNSTDQAEPATAFGNPSGLQPAAPDEQGTPGDPVGAAPAAPPSDAPTTAAPVSGLPHAAPAWGQPNPAEPTVVPPFGAATGAATAPAGKRGPLVPILAALSALLFIGTVTMTALYVAEKGAHDRADRTISQRDATVSAKNAELATMRGDLQKANEDLGKVRTDLAGSQNQADELKRQKQVISKCFNLLGQLGDAAQSGDRATMTKLQPEVRTTCDEADRYLE